MVGVVKGEPRNPYPMQAALHKAGYRMIDRGLWVPKAVALEARRIADACKADVDRIKDSVAHSQTASNTATNRAPDASVSGVSDLE